MCRPSHIVGQSSQYTSLPATLSPGQWKEYETLSPRKYPKFARYVLIGLGYGLILTYELL